MKRFGFVVLAVLVLSSIVVFSSPVLRGTGEYVAVKIRAWHEQQLQITVPSSDEYGPGFTMNLGPDMVGIPTEEWWDEVHQEIVRRYHDPVYAVYWESQEVPSADWLKVRANPLVLNAHLAAVELPDRGKLQRVVDEEDYDSYEGNMSSNSFWWGMTVEYDGKTVCSAGSFHFIDENNGYRHGPEILGRGVDGMLLYRYPNNTDYLIIRLPWDFLTLTEEMMEIRNYEWLICTEILRE